MGCLLREVRGTGTEDRIWFYWAPDSNWFRWFWPCLHLAGGFGVSDHFFLNMVMDFGVFSLPAIFSLWTWRAQFFNSEDKLKRVESQPTQGKIFWGMRPLSQCSSIHSTWENTLLVFILVSSEWWRKDQNCTPGVFCLACRVLPFFFKSLMFKNQKISSIFLSYSGEKKKDCLYGSHFPTGSSSLSWAQLPLLDRCERPHPPQVWALLPASFI